jgi:hypothetical protein
MTGTPRRCAPRLSRPPACGLPLELDVLSYGIHINTRLIYAKKTDGRTDGRTEDLCFFNLWQGACSWAGSLAAMALWRGVGREVWPRFCPASTQGMGAGRGFLAARPTRAQRQGWGLGKFDAAGRWWRHISRGLAGGWAHLQQGGASWRAPPETTPLRPQKTTGPASWRLPAARPAACKPATCRHQRPAAACPAPSPDASTQGLDAKKTRHDTRPPRAQQGRSAARLPPGFPTMCHRRQCACPAASPLP